MALTTTALPRVFAYNGAELPDPGSHLGLEEVRDIYTASFPELTTATIEGPATNKPNKLLYTFTRTAGAKG